MTWQGPPIDHGHAFVHASDPYGAHPASRAEMMGISTDEQFFASGSTREQEELARRKAEHLESAEHIAPQHSYPSYGRTRLNEKTLRENFHLPLSEVAKKFGMCTTAFKKLCRKQGVMQWPHRTLRSLEKKIASLRAEQKFTHEHNQIEDQIRKLQQKREAILSGTNLSSLEGDDIMASPSDDSSTSSTACSGSSSPRATDMSHLTLDDSSSVGSASEERARRSTPSMEGGREFQGWFDGRMPNMGQGGSPRDAPGVDGRRHFNILEREGAGGLGIFHRAALGVPPMHGADPYGLPHRPPSNHPPYPPHHPMAAGPLLPHPPPHPSMWGHYPMELGGHPPGRGADGMPPGLAANPAELQQHVQALMSENQTLKEMIRSMARERHDMARRSDASQAEIANYRAVCHQLETQLGVLSEQQGGEHASDLPPHLFPPLGRAGAESWAKDAKAASSRGALGAGGGERGGGGGGGGEGNQEHHSPPQHEQHENEEGMGGGHENQDEDEHKDHAFGDLHRDHSPHAAFDLHQI